MMHSRLRRIGLARGAAGEVPIGPTTERIYSQIVTIDDLSVVSHCKKVENGQASRVRNGHYMAVRKEELADAGMVAAELACHGPLRS